MSISPLGTSLVIGKATIRNRVALAPMSGVSDVPFRRLAWEAGAGLVVTEMVASRELVGKSGDSLRRLEGAGATPHMVQLAGREAGWMAEAARMAEASGADIIDINMGCPAKKVIGGYSGSALMRDPDHAVSLVRAVADAVSVPVTLKMRLGWDENSLNAAEIGRRAVDAGVQMITVHGRTRSQFYEGRADWQAIANVRAALPDVAFVANGDVESADDAREILAVTGADAVMIGRAAQGRPWLPGEIAGLTGGPTTADGMAAYVARHYELMLDHYGEKVGVRQSRKHLGWYVTRHAPHAPASIKSALMTETDPRAVQRLIGEAFVASAMAIGEAA